MASRILYRFLYQILPFILSKFYLFILEILLVLHNQRNNGEGSVLTESSLSSQIKRTGNILRKDASHQIGEYNRRFESIKDLYDSFLADLFVSDFSYEKAYETAKSFFGSNKVEFAAVDGTEYTRPLLHTCTM